MVEIFCNETVETRDFLIGVVESIHDFKWQSSEVVNKRLLRKTVFVPDELASRCTKCMRSAHSRKHKGLHVRSLADIEILQCK